MDKQFNNFWESVYPHQWRIDKHYFTETDDEVDWLEKEKSLHEHEMIVSNNRSLVMKKLDYGLVKPKNAYVTAEEIKEQIDILEIIKEFVPLHKAGSRWVGKCPFHNEKTPSFYVFPQTKTYCCFGCSEKGDIISFIMKINNLDFKEALSYLESLI